MTDRQHLTYTGDDPVILPGSVAPRPELVTQGTVVEVDGTAVALLLARGDFTETPESDVPDPNASLSVEQPRPRDVVAAEQALAATPKGKTLAELVAGFVDPDTLKGEALDAALREADLKLTGTADEQRDRLADWQDERRRELAKATAAASTTSTTTASTAPSDAGSTTTEEAPRG